MGLSMKENGEKDKLLEKENSFILMEIFMMVNGLIIKLMVLAVILMLKELSMKDIGKMINSMEKE